MLDLNNFPQNVQELIFRSEDDNGYNLYLEVKKDYKKLIQGNTAREQAYIALQFLVIPYLPTQDIADLIRYNLVSALKNEDLNLIERITKKLLFMELIYRDDCKVVLRESLLNNLELITEEINVDMNRKLTTVTDWIKDFVAHINQSSSGTLDRAKYFFQTPYFVKLKESDKNILKKLFDLFIFLNTSSFSPVGFEDDLLIEDELGRLVTTNRGEVVVLYDPNKEKAKKEVQQLRSKSSIQNESIYAKKVISPPASIDKDRFENLAQLAAQYPEGSLERKAVEEEMKKNAGKN